MPDLEREPDTDTDAGTDPVLPPGYVMVQARTTYLEMLENSVVEPPEAPAGCEMRLWRRPPPGQYRELFSAVGGPWGWSGRLLMTDVQLRAVLDDDRIEVWRLYRDETLAGFIELDRRVPGEVEIVYFGLLPELVGRGLGSFALRTAIHHVWTAGEAGPIRRLWLHTCDYDSPTALAFYQKAGFRIYDEHSGPEAYPAEHIARLGERQAGG